MEKTPKQFADDLINEFWHQAFNDKNAFAWSKMNSFKFLKMAHRINEEFYCDDSTNYEHSPQYKFLKNVEQELEKIK